MHKHRCIVSLSVLVFVSIYAHAQKAEAEAAAKAKDWPKAINLYKQVTQNDPSDGASWYALGSAALMAGDAKLAVTGFEQSVKLNNQPFFSLYNLACAQARLGRSEEALNTLEKLAQAGGPFAGQMEKDPDLDSVRAMPRFKEIAEQMKRVAAPCANDAINHQLDFWSGEWEVYDAHGTRQGSSHVDPSLDGCLLVENWQGALGGSGKSFNTYNPGTHKWQQFWVSSGGGVTLYDGEFKDGAMHFTGTQNSRTGNPTPARLTFTALPDGRVRQTGEVSADGGANWTVAYDLYYVRKK
jgi:hypothetical protein